MTEKCYGLKYVNSEYQFKYFGSVLTDTFSISPSSVKGQNLNSVNWRLTKNVLITEKAIKDDAF